MLKAAGIEGRCTHRCQRCPLEQHHTSPAIAGCQVHAIAIKLDRRDDISLLYVLTRRPLAEALHDSGW